MKKVFLVAGLALMAVSCNDDDSKSGAKLQGTWKVTSLTTSTPIDLNGDGTASTNLIAETGCYGNTTLVFGNSSTVVLDAEEFGFDQTTGQTTCTSSPAANGVYAVNGDLVSVVVQGETTVLTRSGNTLSRTEQDDDFGTTTMVLTKQ